MGLASAVSICERGAAGGFMESAAVNSGLADATFAAWSWAIPMGQVNRSGAAQLFSEH